MSSYVLLPGAGGAATWYWHLVSARLRAHDHDAIPVDLPAADPAAGLPEYADLVMAATPGRDDVVLVAQSMGAFTALPVCERRPVAHLVLLNAMIPAPGETAGDWWQNTGSEEARLATAREHGYAEELDLQTYFLHDVPPDVAAAGAKHEQPEADIAFEQPCPFGRWPDVPTTVLAGRDDRLFPAAFQQRLARDRLGLGARVLPGGHLNALSEPDAVAGALLDAARPTQPMSRSTASSST
jgi:pimeloyl-ACP methyl ester carboxylesterase